MPSTAPSPTYQSGRAVPDSRSAIQAAIAHVAGFMDGLRVSLVALAALLALTTAASTLLPSGKDAPR
jgi:hypothetical protein